MALNVPMTRGNDGSYPLPFPGEVFLITRDKVQLSFRDASRNHKYLKGRMFMTNLRMVFLISESHRSKANAESFEVPFRGLWDERFHQPIFSCNNLTATVQYYDDQPFNGDLSIRLDFVEGGVNTFLPVFNNVLLATRVQMDAERRRADNIPPVAISDVAPQAEEYFPHNNVAFVDPSDPSRIYTTQPVSEQTRVDTPQWSVSGDGLRRRRGA